MTQPADDWSARRLHFVGIGGAGMSGLAIIAAVVVLPWVPVTARHRRSAAICASRSER